MSTIKSSTEHLTLNADGSGKDIKFQANGVEKASISSTGAFTSTSIDATKLSGTVPNFTSTGIDDNATAELLSLNADGNTQFGASVPVDTLRYLDLYNTSTGSSAGALFRMVTSNAAGTGNTTTNIIKYKNSGFLINNNDTASSNFTAFGVAGAERMRIDSAGRVTMPYQPCFKAYNNIGTYLTGQGVAVFDQTRVNVGNHYNTSNGRFTAPVDGNYQISFSVLFDNSTSVHGFIYVNGGGQYGLEFYDDTGSNKSVSLVSVIPLNAGDYVSLYIDTANARIHQRYGTFSGYLLG